MTWSIRRATPADAATVIEFNRRLAEESEGKTLDPAVLTPGVQAALADPGKALYFLATTADGANAGQMMLTFEWSDWRNGYFWWIQSVYVRMEFRRQGVFRALFEHVRTLAEQTPEVIGLRLYVDHDNTTAHQTYYQLGLMKSNYFVLEKYPL